MAIDRSSVSGHNHYSKIYKLMEVSVLALHRLFADEEKPHS